MKQIKPQEEKYLQGLMQGMSQREAFLYAYPGRSHWKPNVIDTRASELLKRSEIKVRYAELQQETAEANAVTRNALISRLKFIAIDTPIDMEKLRPADQVRCLELLAKITGCTAPQEEDD